MNLQEYLQQEIGIRKNCHFHDGIWWKKTNYGCCAPLYPLQEIVPGSARPCLQKSFIRYSHVVPVDKQGTMLTRTQVRWLIRGEKLLNYSVKSITDRHRRKAINKAVRCGVTTGMIRNLEIYRGDLHEIYISNASRNKHGLREQWYLEHEEQWWRDLVREYELSGRDWFGAFQKGKLIAFIYSYLVDGVAVLLVNKSNTGYLDSNPNDLLLFNAVMHYKNITVCRSVDAGAAIPIPPTIDRRKKSFGFEPVEIPVFNKNNRVLFCIIKYCLFLAGPILKSSLQAENRGVLFMARTIQKRWINFE